MRDPLRIVMTAGVVAVAVGVFALYPACLQRRAEELARTEGCAGDRPPRRGFYAAIADDQRATRFPGFGPSDVVAAEAAYCVGTYAQACLGLDRADEATRRETCERWEAFDTWFRSVGENAADLCRTCAR